MRLFKVNCALIVTIVLWASAFVGIRYGLGAYSPGALALLRFIVASISMAVIYSQMKNQVNIPWTDRIGLLLLGMAGIGIYNICLNYGEISVSAGIASFIVGLMPVLTLLMSVLIWKESQGTAVWTGITISLSGLLMISLGEKTQAHITAGVFIILISALMGAIYSLISRRYLKYYHPVAVTSWVIWGGTLVLMIFTPALLREMPKADIHATLTAVYMGVFPAALAYVAWNYALNHLPASRAAIYLYGLPLVSTFMAFFILHEKPSSLSVTGGLIALLGAIISNRFRLQPHKQTNLNNSAKV